MGDEDVCTVSLRLVYARRHYVAMAEMRHGLTTLSANNLVVNIKCGY